MTSAISFPILGGLTDTQVVGNRLLDMIILVFAPHAFDDCWKLSLNILSFYSKSGKKR